MRLIITIYFLLSFVQTITSGPATCAGCCSLCCFTQSALVPVVGWAYMGPSIAGCIASVGSLTIGCQLCIPICLAPVPRTIRHVRYVNVLCIIVFCESRHFFL